MMYKRWFSVCVLAAAVLVGCTPASQSLTVADLPTGDAANGAVLYTQAVNGAPTCATCHSIDGTALVGPSLQGYAAVAGTRTDLAADAYTLQSITQPAAHVVSGFTNVMYTQYATKLAPQDLADLVAYLLTLS